MQPITIVDNEYILLQVLQDKKCMFHDIRKPIPDPPLYDALKAGSEALKKYGATKWLSDDRRNGPLSPEMQAWGFNEWGPATIKLGWKYWANVVPQELVAAGALAPVMNAYFGLGLRMQVFSSVEDATAWLDSMQD